MIVTCQKCSAELELPAEVEEGQHVKCPYCGLVSSLQVRLVEVGSAGKEGKAKFPDFVVATTGREYEECIHSFLKANGYNSNLTKASSDQGVDVIVYLKNVTVAIQCKLYSSPVGNDAVQEVVAGANYYKCGVACVVSNAGFTPSAVALSAANNVKLLHHSELLRFVAGLEDGQENDNAFSPDYESTEEYSSLVERANQGFEDARKKLGEYYRLQMMRYVGEDLIVASDYYLKACCVGCREALIAYDNYEIRVEDDPFAIVLDDLFCDDDSPIPDAVMNEIDTEIAWLDVIKSVAKAGQLTKGKQRDRVLDHISFVKKYEQVYIKTAKQMYYLGRCYWFGYGCEANPDIAAGYLNLAAEQGYGVAKELLSVVNGSIEISK